MDAEYSYISPVDADLMEADNLCTLREGMMRYSIMRMASKLKGFFFYPSLTSTTAAETNYSAEDAVRAFNQIYGGCGVFEFQSIVGKLPIDELRTLRMFLEEPYYRMRMSEHSYYVPWPASPVVKNELTMRKNIMKMAGKVKGVFPTLVETENATTAAAESNYSTVEDAMRAFRRMSGGRGVIEFQGIVGKLPIDDLQTLEKLLEEPYHAMLRSEMDPYGYPTWSPEVNAAGSDSFATKLAGQAIGAMLAKVVAGGAVFGALEAPTFLEPLEKAAGAMGLMSVIGGMVVQDKKPGLSRAMVKFGSVAVALAMILPMAGNLDNLIMSWIFGVLTAAIVAVTVTFA